MGHSSKDQSGQIGPTVGMGGGSPIELTARLRPKDKVDGQCAGGHWR